MMGNPKKPYYKEEETQKASLWLITFTDIMALMLTFFVLLYTMASPEEDKWTRMTAALSREFMQFEAPKWNKGIQDSITIDKVDFSRALDLNYLSALLTNKLEGDGLAGEVLIYPYEKSLIVSMPDNLLFKSGSAEIAAEGQGILFKVGESLARISNSIEVVGHSDPTPIQKSGGLYASNWDLSLARAANVAAFLENTGYRKPIVMRGMSSARYDELPNNLGEEKKLSLSRRVDIVVLASTGALRQRFNLQ